MIDSQDGCAICGLMWIETHEEIHIGPLGDAQASPFEGITDAIIHILELPCRHYKYSIKADDWWIVSSSQNATFSVLLDAIPSRYFMFLLLGTPSLDKQSINAYLIRVFDLRSGTFTTIQETLTNYPISFSAAHEDGLLFWQHRTDTKVLLLLRMDDFHQVSKTYCTILNSTKISDAGIYKDVVVWSQQQGNMSSVYLLDLNKDNDLLFDAVDRFPMDGNVMWDSDNDEIGDAADLISARGDCVNSSTRGACFNDLGVFYIIWAGHAVIVTVFAVLGSRWYKESKLKVRRHQEAQELIMQSRKVKRDSIFTNTESQQSMNLPRSFSILTDTVIHPVESGSSDLESQTIAALSFKLDLLQMACHVLILLLTLASLILATAPFWSEHPPTLKQKQSFVWCDLFINYIFFVDLLVRYYLRNHEVHPNLKSFLKTNWPDCLALATDIPGAADIGATKFFVLARFRYVIRLFRITRILKVFRVIRFYRRFTRQNWFIDLMISRPTLFLIVLLGVILLIAAGFLKILEQGNQQEFQSMVCEVNTLWFTVVTITTVGYGDMVPRNLIARVITGGLMLVGIGILGLLTATLLKKLLMGGQGMAEVERRKQQTRQKLELLKSSSARMSMAYNPMAVVYGEHFNKVFPSENEIRATQSRHRSSFLNREKSLAQENVLALEVRPYKIKSNPIGTMCLLTSITFCSLNLFALEF
eukprot:g7140.t1